MCSGFAGLTQYSRRGVVVFKRLQNIIDGAPSLPTFDLESNIDIVSRCTINDGISTLTVNTNGVVDDGGAAAPLRLNDARDINVLFFFSSDKGCRYKSGHEGIEDEGNDGITYAVGLFLKWNQGRWWMRAGSKENVMALCLSLPYDTRYK